MKIFATIFVICCTSLSIDLAHGQVLMEEGDACDTILKKCQPPLQCSASHVCVAPPKGKTASSGSEAASGQARAVGLQVLGKEGAACEPEKDTIQCEGKLKCDKASKVCKADAAGRSTGSGAQSTGAQGKGIGLHVLGKEGKPCDPDADAIQCEEKLKCDKASKVCKADAAGRSTGSGAQSTGAQGKGIGLHVLGKEGKPCDPDADAIQCEEKLKCDKASKVCKADAAGRSTGSGAQSTGAQGKGIGLHVLGKEGKPCDPDADAIQCEEKLKCDKASKVCKADAAGRSTQGSNASTLGKSTGNTATGNGAEGRTVDVPKKKGEPCNKFKNDCEPPLKCLQDKATGLTHMCGEATGAEGRAVDAPVPKKKGEMCSKVKKNECEPPLKCVPDNATGMLSMCGE